ncbi:DUF481 domain-containing protein [Chitinimonas taiwanensis]|uniref:DUF481 domain-containing protein n=1 Tax=Chitinimonas taiwanensis TaxID=240412 RepID=UPI0035B0F18E
MRAPYLLLCLYLSLSSAVALAQAAEWRGDFDVSARYATGSSRELAWELDSELERRANHKRASLQVEVRHDREGEDMEKVRDRYLISPKFEWWDEAERLYTFVDPEYKHDQLEYLRSRASATAGIGAGGFSVGAGELRFETGLGGRQSRYQDGRRQSAVLWVVRNRLDYPLGTGLSAFQTLALERSRHEEQAEAEFGLKQKLSERLSLRARLTLTYSQPVEVDSSHLDTESRLSVAYSF